jgi:hypothetical protein
MIMDEIELAFFNEFCERAKKDGCDLPMAASLIHELHAAQQEARPIKPGYMPSLAQFLALYDVLNIQQIEWFPKAN